MARPTKQGIDYFPLDCVFDDKTEMFLIERGSSGLGVLVTIWQMIYTNEGYFIIDNEDLHLLIKRKIDVGINEVSDCINTCLRRNIFNESLYKKHKILTSKAIQKRYFDAAKKKKIVQIVQKYLIIPVDSYNNLVNSSDNVVNIVENSTKEEEEVKEEVKVNGNSRFTPPTHEQIKKYITEKDFDIDGEKFINFYEAKGWMIGKNKMKSWKACIRTWVTKKEHNKSYGAGGI